ncbi:MAG TPA: diiron oxygenase [Acidimicrobiales bacterium]|jgi:hypothetical protein|nr:diiron oxygenase [Acidimicrobiales bacterium]
MDTAAGALLDEEQQTDDGGAFTDLVQRLSRQSVTPGKHFDAYVDVPWDDPDFAIDPHDPRWELGDDDPLGATDWYKRQPQEVRARLGLHEIVAKMKVGLQFESVLKRGLLEFASELPDESPEFRYAYHEVIEEAHHSLMFQEFVNRCAPLGLRVRGMDRLTKFGARGVIKMGRRSPALFFVFVLGGEDPIDHVQRTLLRSARDLHPLTERIMRIHVTEEARHLSFARHYLKREVPGLSAVRRHALALRAPFILGQMAGMMLKPTPEIVKAYGIPKDVLREAYSSPEARQGVWDSLRKVRQLLTDLRLVTPASKRLWKAFGIWDPAAT